MRVVVATIVAVAVAVVFVATGIPQGWEKRQHSDGRDYYVDHSTKTTHWNPPAGYSD